MVVIAAKLYCRNYEPEQITPWWASWQVRLERLGHRNPFRPVQAPSCRTITSSLLCSHRTPHSWNGGAKTRRQSEYSQQISLHGSPSGLRCCRTVLDFRSSSYVMAVRVVIPASQWVPSTVITDLATRPGTTLQYGLVKAPESRLPLTCRRQMAHPILLPPRSFPFCPDPRSGNPLQGNSAVNTSIIGDVRFLGGSDERIQNAAEHILPRSLSQKLLWSLRTSWPSNSSLLAVGGPSRAKRSEALVAMGAILRRLDLTMKHR